MKTKFATILFLGVALFLAWKAKRPPEPEDPRSVIYDMLNASKSGDVPRYLDSYDSSMAASLKPTVSAQYLHQISGPVKGAALSEPQTTAGEARVEVQFIYQDRTDRQTFYLIRRGAWKIARTEEARAVRNLVPYGTPIRLTAKH